MPRVAGPGAGTPLRGTRTPLRRLHAGRDLRAGLAGGELEVHFQPVVALETLRVVALEALVRWRHPRRGLVLPAVFLARAERMGLIGRLGAQVLERACAVVGAWQHQIPGYEGLRLHVNASPLELADPTYPLRVLAAAEGGGLRAGTLGIELTEALPVDPVATVGVAAELRAQGVELVLDDFGSGWSTLERADLLRPDVLKLDGRIAAGVGGDAGSGALVAGVLAMAAHLGADVVVEGIEHDAQLDALRELGCTHGQGLLLGPPMPAGVLEEVLWTRRGPGG